MEIKNNISKIIVSLIITFIMWLSYTVSSIKTKVFLLENNFSRVKTNSDILKDRELFIMNSRLLHQNHELRLQLLEKK